MEKHVQKYSVLLLACRRKVSRQRGVHPIRLIQFIVSIECFSLPLVIARTWATLSRLFSEGNAWVAPRLTSLPLPLPQKRETTTISSHCLRPQMKRLVCTQFRDCDNWQSRAQFLHVPSIRKLTKLDRTSILRSINALVKQSKQWQSCDTRYIRRGYTAMMRWALSKGFIVL